MDFWGVISTSLATSLIGGIVVAIINYFVIKKQIVFELEENQKRKAYKDFLDKARGFMGDPSLSKEELLSKQQEFIAKVYNDIWVSASDDVLLAVDNFFKSVSISMANDDEATRALNKLAMAIRNDLKLQTKSDIKYTLYAPLDDKK